MVNKIDYKKALKQLYNPPKHGFHMVEVPAMNFLKLDGKGDPNTSPDYQLTVDALYTMSYGIKFALKPQGYDHIVPPIEGLWRIAGLEEFSSVDKSQFEWTMMIMQPEWVTAECVEQVRLDAKKKKANPLLDKVRFESIAEGLAVQIVYTGAYKDESPTIAAMHEFIRSNGYQFNGLHHEIYLGDPRKTSPERLKTILRQPVIKL